MWNFNSKQVSLSTRMLNYVLQKGVCRMKTVQYDLYGRAKVRVSPVKALIMDLDFFLKSYAAALKNPIPLSKKQKTKT